MSALSPTRRAVFGLSAGAVAIAATVALPTLVAGAGAWSPADWLDRWGRLGCGARLDGHRLLQLTPRAGQEGPAGMLLGELGTPGRIESVKALLVSVDHEDGAVRAVRVCREIEAQCPADDAPQTEQDAWVERSRAAEHRLLLVPARTGKGLADKLRIGLEINGSDLGELIVAQVIAQLERMA